MMFFPAHLQTIESFKSLSPKCTFPSNKILLKKIEVVLLPQTVTADTTIKKLKIKKNTHDWKINTFVRSSQNLKTVITTPCYIKNEITLVSFPNQ